MYQWFLGIDVVGVKEASGDKLSVGRSEKEKVN